MAFIDDLAEMMPDTVTWKQFLSRNAYGAPTYGDPGTEYRARVVRKQKMIRSIPGDQVIASGEVWICGSPDIKGDDVLVLPDSSTPTILAVERFPDEGGDCYTKVYFA